MPFGNRTSLIDLQLARLAFECSPLRECLKSSASFGCTRCCAWNIDSELHMLQEWLLPILILFGVACGLFPIFLLLLRRPQPVTADEEISYEPILGEFTEPLAAQMPMSTTVQNDVHRLLMGAGFYHPTALTEFRAVRTALLLAPVFLTLAGA